MIVNSHFKIKYFIDSYAIEWFEQYKKNVHHRREYLASDFFIYKSFSSELVKFVFEVCSRFGVHRQNKFKCLELFDLLVNAS